MANLRIYWLKPSNSDSQLKIHRSGNSDFNHGVALPLYITYAQGPALSAILLAIIAPCPGSGCGGAATIANAERQSLQPHFLKIYLQAVLGNYNPITVAEAFPDIIIHHFRNTWNDSQFSASFIGR